MPTFNQFQLKLISMYLDHRDNFTSDELHDLLMNLITYKADGSKYSGGVIISRLTSLNKRLRNEYGLTTLSPEADAINKKYKKDLAERPLEEKKEDEKLEFSMDEVKEVSDLYTAPFQDIEKNRALFVDKSRRKDRNILLTHINNIYATLQINSGVRINELVQREFRINGCNVTYITSKGNRPREFIPLWMSNKEWLDILNKVREIVGKETVSAVNKRYNEYLKFNYKTLTKSHDLRKVYLHLTKDHDTNPLGHGNRDLVKVYDCLKPKEEDKEQVQEIKDEIHLRNDKKRCDICMKDVLSKNMSRHMRSKKHTIRQT